MLEKGSLAQNTTKSFTRLYIEKYKNTNKTNVNFFQMEILEGEAYSPIHSIYSHSYFLFESGIWILQLQSSWLAYPGGGHSHWKGVWGCAAVMTPFSQASHRSLAYQFNVNAPLLCPLFSIFRKFLHFQPCFDQNSSSLDPNFFQIFVPKTPIFQGKSTPLTLHFGTRVAHIHQKKSWVPPRGLTLLGSFLSSSLMTLASVGWVLSGRGGRSRSSYMPLSRPDWLPWR